MAGLYFSNENSLQEFIQIIEGKCSESCVAIRIDSLNQKENWIDYRKIIDVISAEEMDSSLSCQEYIYLYCMLRKGFHPSIKERLEKLFLELQITELREQKVKALSKGTFCIIRSLAAYLQGCRVLVLKNALSIYTENEKKAFHRFWQRFLDCDGIGLVLSTSERELKTVTDQIYNMDEK
ncbi:MAG: hypothetical protein IKL07_03255 [Clostridium sp.]|nr:hypothetical protein [Clostridium sp.]